MKYVICNTNTHLYFILTGRQWTADKTKATYANSETGIKNIISDHKKIFDSIQANIQIEELRMEETLQMTEAEALEQLQIAETALHSLQLQIAETALHSFYEACNNLEQLQIFFTTQQSIMDRKQEDVLHKIEFGSVLGVNGVKYSKMLKDIRIKRRIAKDSIKILENIKAAYSKAQSYENQKESLESRIYSPRELTELFGRQVAEI